MTFFVEGKPIGQGRISTINGRSFHSNGAILKPWREAIAWKARQAHLPLLSGAVRLELRFVLTRGVTVKRKYPIIVPDLDHYIRAVGDSLKGILFLDDSQVVQILASKEYGEPCGVHITITEIP